MKFLTLFDINKLEISARAGKLELRKGGRVMVLLTFSQVGLILDNVRVR